MLKMTKIELELISDIDMDLFIKKGMRGGISYIAKRQSQANNKCLKDYDDGKESVFIMYLHVNNLYGWAMTQYLPYGGFKWLNQKDISDFCLDSISKNSSIGNILEVDLEYPSELHDLHHDYPLAPQKLKISQDMLSKYCSDIANKYGIKIGGVNKLVSNLKNKEKFVIHYRNLQLYLSLGMKVSKVHRILKFKQSDWLQKFVDFKLMTNSVYGKTMENLRKRIFVELIDNAKDYVRCVSRPSFVSQKIFSKNFVTVNRIKPVLTFNKPIYVGFSILELSKLLR